jgi:hypothetical protein
VSPAPPDPTDDQLGDLLREVGAHLELGPGATEEGRADLVAAVLAALPEAPAEPVDGGGAPRSARPPADRRRPPRLLVAAAVLLVIGLAVLTVAPAREAVARWLGIGAVRIERTDQPVVTGPASSTSPGAVAPTRPDGSIDVEAVAQRVPFEVRLPTAEVAGEPTAASTDPAVPSGLIEVRYPGFTLVELASQPGGAPVVAKFLGPGTETAPVTVAGQPGLWITGDPHEVAFIDPDGATRLDRVRRAGDVLLWEEGGVTYRIEGAPSLDEALAVAGSLR